MPFLEGPLPLEGGQQPLGGEIACWLAGDRARPAEWKGGLKFPYHGNGK